MGLSALFNFLIRLFQHAAFIKWRHDKYVAGWSSFGSSLVQQLFSIYFPTLPAFKSFVTLVKNEMN